MKSNYVSTALAILALVACNEAYDPIGPNKPAPVLIVSPLEMAFDGTGGTSTSVISTNAEEITIGELPDWIESATLNEDNTIITVQAKSNPDSYEVRKASLKLVCSSGDNSVTQYMRLYQAGMNSRISFTPFSGKVLPSEGWTADDPTSVSTGNGYLSFSAGQSPGRLYTCATQLNPSAGKFYFSVDIRMNSAESGVKLFLNDNPNHVVEIYTNYRSATNRGGIWVKNGNNWLAMDDGIVGSGDHPNKFEDVYEIPAAEERDDWWRLSAYNTKSDDGGIVVTIKSLKTFNGETSELNPHYSRVFHFAEATSSRIALWARAGESQFKNFVLSYEE